MEVLRRLLYACEGDVNAVATALGLPRRYVYGECQKHGLVPSDFLVTALAPHLTETHGATRDIDWSEAPIAKAYGIWNTRYAGPEFKQRRPLDERQNEER